MYKSFIDFVKTKLVISDWFKMSSWFRTSSGVRQGSVVSSILFML
jgi:hypothetical protein